jgi:Aldo/keto reductase family
MSQQSQTVSAAVAGSIRLGDLTVNRLGYGAMRITGKGIWGPPADHKAAIATLRRAVDLGVNFIDTADSYGPYVSEELIAEALAPYPDGLVIATKGGWERVGPGQWIHNASPKHLEEAVAGSLKRLRLDRIDVYQLHIPDPAVSFDASMETLARGGQDPQRSALKRDTGTPGARAQNRSHRFGTKPLQLCGSRMGLPAGSLHHAGHCIHSLGSAGPKPPGSRNA